MKFEFYLQFEVDGPRFPVGLVARGPQKDGKGRDVHSRFYVDGPKDDAAEGAQAEGPPAKKKSRKGEKGAATNWLPCVFNTTALVLLVLDECVAPVLLRDGLS